MRKRKGYSTPVNRNGVDLALVGHGDLFLREGTLKAKTVKNQIQYEVYTKHVNINFTVVSNFVGPKYLFLRVIGEHTSQEHWRFSSRIQLCCPLQMNQNS